MHISAKQCKYRDKARLLLLEHMPFLTTEVSTVHNNVPTKLNHKKFLNKVILNIQRQQECKRFVIYKNKNQAISMNYHKAE